MKTNLQKFCKYAFAHRDFLYWLSVIEHRVRMNDAGVKAYARDVMTTTADYYNRANTAHTVKMTYQQCALFADRIIAFASKKR